jgi:AhpD family alkylhydroperoxidase
MDEMTYPERYDRMQRSFVKLGRAMPAEMAGFAALRKASTAGRALPSSTRELIALGIAVAVHCESCLAYHVHDALRAGASRDEIIDAIGVGVLMGGAPAAVYAAEAYEALEQFEAVGPALSPRDARREARTTGAGT